MQLRRFKLAYVCQHVELEQRLSPGILAIVGENGSGKSNLVNMIRASVTNDFSSLEGNKADNICRNIPAGAPSYVETEWETATGIIVLRRALANATTELRLNGNVVATKEDDVTRQALTYLHLSAAVFDTFLFADYIKLIQIASGTKSTRAELIKSLCGLEVVERADRYLREAANADAAVVAQYDPADLEAELLRWSSAKTSIRNLSASLLVVEADLLSDADVLMYKRKLKMREQAINNREELVQVKDRLRKSIVQHAELQQELDRLNSASTLLTQEEQKLRDKINTATQLHKAYSTYQQYREQCNQLLAAMSKEKPELPVFDDTDLALTAEEAAKEIVLAEQKLTECERLLKLIASNDEVVCPTCFRPLEVTPEYRRSLLDAKQQAGDKLETAKTCEDIWRNRQAIKQRHEVAVKIWRHDVAEATAKRAALKEPLAAGVKDQGHISAWQNKLSTIVEKLQNCRKQIVECEKMLAVVDDRNQNSQALCDKLQAELDTAGKIVASKKAESIRQALADNEQKLKDRLQLQVELKSQRAMAKEYLMRIKKLRRQRRKLRKLRQWTAVQNRARDALKRDRLPARVIAGMLQRTTSKLNQYLSKLSVPFFVQADPAEFSFLVHHNDGKVERARRLSTGQSLCLGISFWLARADVFAGQLPFFCFDEPTSNLDQEHVTLVAELFAQLSNELAKKQRQGLVITHHDALARAAAQVLYL